MKKLYTCDIIENIDKEVRYVMGKVSFRHNIMNIRSIKSFYSIRGGCNNNVRDVYFVRVIGENQELKTIILEADRQMDMEMAKGKLSYKRISRLPLLVEKADSEFYTRSFATFETDRKVTLKSIVTNRELEAVIAEALLITVNLYKSLGKNVTDSMIRNFGTKLLFWLDQEIGSCFKSWSEKSCIKVVADNIVKEQEYLFYLFLTCIGCDVLLIENRSDISIDEKALKYSNAFSIGTFGEQIIPNYCQFVQEKNENPEHNREDQTIKKVVIPVKNSRKNIEDNSYANTGIYIPNSNTISNSNSEKSFEELAQLASSVVLIAVHNQDGEVIGTGSGIMIGNDGYILTNNHVASGGYFYSVRIENDEETYVTNEVIKYNSVIDLAIIRIKKQLNPIPLYKGRKKLVRGQKVVAIGSPLGLFNSVSDGIISGFRNINDVDMIQFTAPISHGSSGGAVLNMQGEVIGISTAGIDSGQNINLAIGYENIQLFTNGFM